MSTLGLTANSTWLEQTINLTAPENELSVVSVQSFQMSSQRIRCISNLVMCYNWKQWSCSDFGTEVRRWTKEGSLSSFNGLSEKGRKQRPCFLTYKQEEQKLSQKGHGSLFHPFSISRARLILFMSTGSSKHGVSITDDFSQSSEGNVPQTLNSTRAPGPLQLATLKGTTEPQANNRTERTERMMPPAKLHSACPLSNRRI